MNFSQNLTSIEILIFFFKLIPTLADGLRWSPIAESTEYLLVIILNLIFTLFYWNYNFWGLIPVCEKILFSKSEFQLLEHCWEFAGFKQFIILSFIKIFHAFSNMTREKVKPISKDPGIPGRKVIKLFFRRKDRSLTENSEWSNNTKNKSKI